MKDRTDGSGMINPIIDPGNVRQICCHCDLNIAESLPITKNTDVHFPDDRSAIKRPRDKFNMLQRRRMSAISVKTNVHLECQSDSPRIC